MAAVQIRRDPYWRDTLYRERADHDGECAWCGERGRFRYWWEADSLFAWTKPDVSQVFCSIGCWQLYTP